jgi:hypothetical protein
MTKSFKALASKTVCDIIYTNIHENHLKIANNFGSNANSRKFYAHIYSMFLDNSTNISALTISIINNQHNKD